MTTTSKVIVEAIKDSIINLLGILSYPDIDYVLNAVKEKYCMYCNDKKDGKHCYCQDDD